MSEYTWKVDKKQIQLLSFLKEELGSLISGKSLKKALDSNQCFVNGKIERFGTRWLGEGDEVSLHLEQVSPSSYKSVVLYEDQDFLICNKPPGIISESDSLKKQLANKPSDLILLHRLDKETSGVLLFAKSEKIQEQMIQLFREKRVFKKYYAIVDGIPMNKEGMIDNYIGKISSYHGQSIWGPVSPEKGLRAITKWKLASIGSNAALIECFPLTGRTHQLRVHLSQIGHPILGDFQYGRNFKCFYKPPRHLLHASELSFSHPLTKQTMAFKAPFHEDYNLALNEIFAKGENPWNF